LCPRCGYRLRGIDSSRCPECGTPFNAEELILRANGIVGKRTVQLHKAAGAVFAGALALPVGSRFCPPVGALAGLFLVVYAAVQLVAATRWRFAGDTCYVLESAAPALRREYGRALGVALIGFPVALGVSALVAWAMLRRWSW
jgi:hypothetical protein